MSTKITIKSESKIGQVFTKYMAEKSAFRDAVKTGKIGEYIKSRNVKFDSPVSVKP